MLLALLAACAPSPPAPGPAPALASDAPALAPRGCLLDEHATSECFASAVSPEHHDLLRGVGSARHLRERVVREWVLDARGLPVEIRHRAYEPPLVWAVRAEP